MWLEPACLPIAQRLCIYLTGFGVASRLANRYSRQSTTGQVDGHIEG